MVVCRNIPGWELAGEARMSSLSRLAQVCSWKWRWMASPISTPRKTDTFSTLSTQNRSVVAQHLNSPYTYLVLAIQSEYDSNYQPAKYKDFPTSL